MILCGSVVSYAKGFSPSKRVARHFHICNQISSVENIDDYFVVHLSKEQQSDNSLSYIQYFGYSGRSLDANIFFPPNSAHSCYLNGTDLYINFILPFVSEYTGHLTCWDKAKLDIDHVSPQKEDNKYLMKKFDANISIKAFQRNTEESQLLCYGNSSFDRWCDAKRIGISNENIIFQTKALIEFPNKFFNAGGRSEPFIDPEDILYDQPTITNKHIEEISLGESQTDDIIFISSIAKKNKNPYNFIVNFLIPAYKTINSLDPQKTKEKIFYIKNLEHGYFDSYFEALSNHHPLSLPKNHVPLFVPRAIIGLQKGDKSNDPMRSDNLIYDDLFNYSKKDVEGLRKNMLEVLKVPKPKEEKLVIISSRFDFNSSEVKQTIEENCKSCTVKIMDCSEDDYECKIKTIAHAKIFIAKSNYDTESVFWMESNTTFIEITPYLFDDYRYEMLANTAGVRYLKYMNENNYLNYQILTAEQKDCYVYEGFRKTSFCRDIIGRKDFNFNPSSFISFMKNNSLI